MNNINQILKYMNELFNNPTCELNYNRDYELLIAIVLSAQTTDKKVNKVTEILFDKYKSIKDLSESNIYDLNQILKPLGMSKKKSTYVKEIALKLHNEYNDIIPNDREALEALKGVGRKTANVVMGILFNEPCIAVDTHVARISKRLKLVENKDNVFIIEKKLTKLIQKDLLVRTHYQFVLFGRYYCKAIKPKCSTCKLKDICIYENKRL